MGDLSDVATEMYLTGYEAFQRYVHAEADSAASAEHLAESALFSGAASDLHLLAADTTTPSGPTN